MSTPSSLARLPRSLPEATSSGIPSSQPQTSSISLEAPHTRCSPLPFFLDTPPRGAESFLSLWLPLGPHLAPLDFMSLLDGHELNDVTAGRLGQQRGGIHEAQRKLGHPGVLGIHVAQPAADRPRLNI